MFACACACVCMHLGVTDCGKFSPASTTIMLMFLVFESLLFGLFTAIMCLTQLCAIASDHSVRTHLVSYQFCI